MQRVGWICGTALALGLSLVAGCSSTRHRAPSAAAMPAAPVEPGLDSSAERLARAHAHYSAGFIFDLNEESEAALQEYCLAAQQDPENQELLLKVSDRCLRNKQPEKALEVLRAAAARPDASSLILAQLGLVYYQLGKYDQAAVADRQAIARGPQSLAGYQNLFLTCLQDKKSGNALRVLDEAARQHQVGAEFLVGVAELYGQYLLQAPSQKDKVAPRQLAVLKRAGQLHPTSPDVRLRLADGLNSAGAPDAAVPLYLELLQELPDAAFLRERLHAKLATIYLRANDNPHAIEQLEAFIHDDPDNPQAYFYLGRLCYEQNKPAQAAGYFSKAIVLRPDYEEAYYDLALAQLGANSTSDALATLDQARRKFPPTFQMELWTGLAYTRQKAWREALSHFTAAELIARTTDPSRLTDEFYFELAAAYERSGDLDQAEQYFEKCLKLTPNFASALNYLGYMWAEHGIKLEQARDLIEKAVKQEPKNPAYLDSLGWVLFKLKHPRQALTYVLKAVELTPEADPTLMDHLGDIYNALGQSEKARDAWRKSLSLETNDEVRKKLDTAEHH
jgi:tetratricopeptide (TPR) repeat protein